MENIYTEQRRMFKVNAFVLGAAYEIKQYEKDGYGTKTYTGLLCQFDASELVFVVTYPTDSEKKFRKTETHFIRIHYYDMDRYDLSRMSVSEPVELYKDH